MGLAGVVGPGSARVPGLEGWEGLGGFKNRKRMWSVGGSFGGRFPGVLGRLVEDGVSV